MNTEKTPKILIIDDDQPIRELMVASLSDTYDVVEAYDGLSGIEMAETENPDMILCDLLMPTMTGTEFLHMAKERNIFPRIPILIVTASQYVSFDKLPVEKEDVIFKPFSIENLLNRIKEKLNSNN